MATRGLILLCVAAVATAEVGYNYQPSVGSVGSHHGLASHGVSSGLLGPAIPVSLGAPVSVGGPVSIAAPVSAPAPVSIAAPVEYSKEFYSYSAPEGDFNDAEGIQNIANSLKKTLRVVFIKGPENTALENAALQLAKQAGDERTAIYVLQKQSDIGGLAKQLQNLRSQSQSHPEVHFVKYRTPQDAQNAQRAIQSQYDSLPGSSQSHDGGNADVLNFASAGVPVRRASAQIPSNAYLPSSVIRLVRR